MRTQAYVIDHSDQLHVDFAKFLFNETLSDLLLVVRKGHGAFDIHLDNDDEDPVTFDASKQVKIPVHKLVLSARCPYFFTQFCKGNWGDKDQKEA